MLLSTHGLQPKSASFIDETSWDLDGVDEKLANPTGIANQYTTIQADAGMGANVKWSVSFWVKLDTMETNDMFYKITDSTGATIQILYVNVVGRLTAFMTGSTSNWTRSANGAISTGSWFHVAMVYDGTLGRYSRQKIYVNASTSGSTSNFYSANHPASTGINIGAGVSSLFINGHINEFAVFYGTALSAADVTTLYNSGTATDLNEFTTPPTNWYRSENATWDGTKWTMPDANANGPNLESENMQEASRTNDVPT